jgi:superfamily II DNA or RNA helicase/HKD family nuclease/diadenosine tetraphosphate (Ap4A) HIT family hydrolase
LHNDENCPFCKIGPERIAFDWTHGHAIWDGFPVSPGHLLLIPYRHAATWDDLAAEEKAALTVAIDQAMAVVRARHTPNGFNVGFNVGAAAGQTVFHFHLHVIPRYSGDVADPRGGVRHVIPSKANYLSKGSGPEADQQRLIKGAEDPLLPHLILHMDRADTCDIAVSFLLDSGARRIVEHLKDLLQRGGSARILVGDYLDVTEPVALRRICDLQGKLSFRIYQSAKKAFHLKSYAFLTGPEGVAFVGSSNLSESALTDAVEWNYKVISSHDVGGFQEIRQGFQALFDDFATAPVTPTWIDAYERRRRVPNRFSDVAVPPELPLPKPEPHQIQQKALSALEETRANGFSAGLVVLATGLGKTWLAGFDCDRPEFKRILFVAHREEILDQAVAVFRRIMPNGRIGRLAAERREVDADVLFASVQTLGRTNHLSSFREDHFDYLIIDEFHHAAATTYRRIIDHFSPKFLLGLTATPDRTDGADLLGLCQENLVFRADLADGIGGGHLCPFHYFGVPDEVDYTNIPWRNAQFDVNELTAAIATEARARNALEQFRKLGGRRCLAFCCSQRHADFMADFFESEGVSAVAVHSGQGSAPRATSLERLERGELHVVFAVDMFNEGVDVPTIDTVLMLRPTESTIIWLQQMGRGLRIAPDKDRLTVIDYIGNHRVFLTKLRALALIADRDAESAGRQREVLEAIVNGRLGLPAGCEVTYDLATIEILEVLLRPTRSEDLLEAFYREFLDRHGLRPTAIETFHAGLNPRANSERSWLGFVHRMNGLDEADATTLQQHLAFFERLEITPTVRSYKIILLLGMLDGDDVRPRLSIEEVAARAAGQVRRMHRLAEDFSVDLSSTDALQRLLIRNPIEAFVEGEGMGGVSYFAFDGREFSFRFEIENPTSFGRLLREVLDWRLGQYLARGASDWSGDVVCRVALNASHNPMLFLPTSPDSPTLPQGVLPIEVDKQSMEAVVAKIAINVVRRSGETSNQLPDILRGWFGDVAGNPGRGDRVRLRKTSSGTIMEPIGARVDHVKGVGRWERYLREEIPPAFGLTFSRAIWNVGFVVSEPNMFLLVSLEKTGANPDHQYVDHFVSDREFSWQSQNRTTQQSKHGQMIQGHRAKGLNVHLFVRPGRRGPFVYCGEVDFVSWEGSAPISVQWRLREPVPQTLWPTLQVPQG